MANLKVIIEYVDGLEYKEYVKFMNMMEKYDNDVYWEISDFKMNNDLVEELKEDYDVMKELKDK